MKGTAVFCYLSLVLMSLDSFGEMAPHYPEVGQACPEFTLHNIRYYPKKEAHLQDFRGQWLVLDFWNKACGACIASFRKVSHLQQEFEGKVQFMMVGIQDREKQIEPMFARFRAAKGLVMPCAFDSGIAQRFDIYTAPYIIVIDPQGIVRAITYSLSESDIQSFLAGNMPSLRKAYRIHEEEIDTRIPFDPKKFFLVQGNGGSDTAFLFRSLLSLWDGITQNSSFPDSISQDSMLGNFQVLGAPLYMLYNYAYFGTRLPYCGYHIEPVLEIRDSSSFQWSSANSTHLFSYSLHVPPAKAYRSRLQAMLQRDLENYFGYGAKVETRNFPCWRLISHPDAAAHLRTKGGRPTFRSAVRRDDFTLRNKNFTDLVELLRNYCGLTITDDSDIHGDVDVEVKGCAKGVEGVRGSLQHYGLELVPSAQPLQVLVIRDK